MSKMPTVQLPENIKKDLDDEYENASGDKVGSRQLTVFMHIGQVKLCKDNSLKT